MKRKHLLLWALLTMSSTVMLQAQTVVQIRLTDGSSETYRVSASGGLYFSGDSLLIATTSRAAGVVGFPLERIGRMTWGNTADIAAIEAPTFTLRPNPVEHSFTLDGLGEGLHRVDIFSINGRLVRWTLCADGQPIEVNDLPRGVYFVRVGSTTRKMIKL